jgi:hypothetical protein
MSILTYLTQAAIRDSVQSLEGEMLTRPALIRADGSSVTYAADVKISGYDEPLRNVPVAMGNRELSYAEVGQAVTLTRSTCGTFEITGFAKKKPGTRMRIPVYLGTINGAIPGQPGISPVVGPAIEVGLRVYRLTILDMGSLPYAPDGWGSLPLGSYALYRGSVLVGLNGVMFESGGEPATTAPTIQTFTVTPDSITAGGGATLQWTVFGATSVSIDQGVGTVAASSSRSVTPSATTTYTLTASNPSGTVTATVTLTVGTEVPSDLAFDFGSTP